VPYVSANGINIFYEVRGKGHPLILLMGLGADGAAWEVHVAEFEKYFSCYLIDNRGAGKTDKPEGPYDTVTMANDVLGLMDALNIEHAHINGCSLGGMIAQEIALTAPQRTDAIVLTASMAKLDNYGISLLRSYLYANEHYPRRQFRQFVNLTVYSRHYFNSYGEMLVQKEDAAVRNPTPQPEFAYRAQIEAILAHDSVARLSHIKNPCLVYTGDSDFLSPVEHADWMAQTLPKGELCVMEDRGHVFHFEEAERYNRKVVDFLLQQKI